MTLDLNALRRAQIEAAENFVIASISPELLTQKTSGPRMLTSAELAECCGGCRTNSAIETWMQRAIVRFCEVNGIARPSGVPVTHPTDGERDLAALCARLVRRLREVSPDDKLAATATDYLNQRRYLNPLRIKAMGPAPAPGVPVARGHTVSPSPTDGSNK